MLSLEELARDLEEKQRIFSDVLFELIDEARTLELKRLISLIEEAFKEDSDSTMLANLRALLQLLKRQALERGK